MKEIKLKDTTWTLGDAIGSGGFGQVFEGSGKDGQRVAIKLIPKSRGGPKELLFEDLKDVEPVNAVPIIDSGEYGDSWAIVMPRADRSLRDELNNIDDEKREILALTVLDDINAALVSITGKVVHRDIKPENILYLDGGWKLTDFGISRYAEATTSPDTKKHALSYCYASPEQWNHTRATTQSDVYSLGVVVYEILAGQLPFEGTDNEDYRRQHIKKRPKKLDCSDSLLSSLVLEMLLKAAGSRPTPSNIAKRLKQMNKDSVATIDVLENANLAEVERKTKIETDKMVGLEKIKDRELLYKDGGVLLESIKKKMMNIIEKSAPYATFAHGSDKSNWQVQLNMASLEFPPYSYVDVVGWDKDSPPNFDVVAECQIILTTEEINADTVGRSHSLWYCDPEEEGVFKWYELAFMQNPIIRSVPKMEPYELSAEDEATGKTLAHTHTSQIAWPMTALEGRAIR